ncbi:GNAT family N-acetyltransferase [Actinoplanes sp. HUAS TT8]|uniref:GNAT family N-acetyltransferase n=1 Tax=Actinoplanes sp. HUAS TT8 TaxID=3447453 RepID=UPI003F51C094
MPSAPGLVVRPITGPDEVDLFNTLPYLLNDEITGDLDAGRRRPEWLWVALRGDRVTARAAWWSRPGDARPSTMDIFDAPDPGDGRELLRAALPAVSGDAVPPHYIRFLPPDWKGDERARRETESCLALLGETGARLFVERLRWEWRPGTPLRAPSGRLEFRPPRDAGELIDLMELVLDGTLDAYSRDDLTRMTPREAAEQQFEEELARYAGPRDWWRIATRPGDGDPVGFVVPAHNGYHAIIAYLGVVPAHRGHGYIDDVLAAGTRVLADQDAPRIRAATDVTNTPMAAAFARAGYETFQHRLDLTWSS